MGKSKKDSLEGEVQQRLFYTDHGSTAKFLARGGKLGLIQKPTPTPQSSVPHSVSS